MKKRETALTMANREIRIHLYKLVFVLGGIIIGLRNNKDIYEFSLVLWVYLKLLLCAYPYTFSPRKEVNSEVGCLMFVEQESS